MEILSIRILTKSITHSRHDCILRIITSWQVFKWFWCSPSLQESTELLSGRVVSKGLGSLKCYLLLLNTKISYNYISISIELVWQWDQGLNNILEYCCSLNTFIIMSYLVQYARVCRHLRLKCSPNWQLIEECLRKSFMSSITFKKFHL